MREAAAGDGVKVPTHCREAILAWAMPGPEFTDVSTPPVGLRYFLLLGTRGKTWPVWPVV